MKLLVDINVILDAVLERDPWTIDSAALLAHIEAGRATGCVAGHTITTVHYVTISNQNKHAATAAISDMLRFLDVVAVEKVDFQQALAMHLPDFEDAVQATCALKVGADYIATRNEKDFRGIAVAPLAPSALLSLLST